MDLIEDFEAWRHRHHTSAAPAAEAVTINTSTPGGNPMSLAKLEDDVKNDLTKGIPWLKGFVGRLEAAAPGIIANAEQYENSPIVQALENAFLPPAVEQQIANMITELGKQFPAPAAVAQDAQQAEQPAPTFTPAGPVVAGQA